MKTCSRCGYYTYDHTGNVCHCVLFDYRIPEDDEMWRSKHARDEKTLAEGIAEQHYCDDPCDPSRFDLEIEVRNTQMQVAKFKVTAEARVVFIVGNRV